MPVSKRETKLLKILFREIKKMNILIFIPRYKLKNVINYDYTFPLGFGYISSVLKNHGYNVDCVNLNHYNGKIEDLVIEALNKKMYDIVCTGGMALLYIVLEKIIRSVRTHESKPIIVLGGAIVTSEPELMIKSLKPDFGVIGEGEETIIELLESLDKNNYKDVNGIAYLDKQGTIKITKPRMPIANLDSLPYPDFEGFEYSVWLDNICSNEIFNATEDFPRVYPILASRGCPYQCTFCYHSLGPKYRKRSISNVINEIRHNIKKYRINMINLFDDLFSINRERLLEFCSKMKEIIDQIPGDCKWGCQMAVNSVDKELLQTMKDSGCCLISYGFESMSSEILKSMRKPITPEQILRAYRLTREININIQANFIFGDIAETKKTAEITIDRWIKHFRGQVSLGFIQPYPGSEIYKHCIRKGIINDKLSFIKQLGVPKAYNMTDNMTDKEFNELKNNLLRTYIRYSKYVLPRIHKRKKGIYDFYVTCPYCKTKMEYKNLRISNRLYIVEYLACRNCYRRFFAVNIVKKIANIFYVQLKPLINFYEKRMDSLLKKKVGYVQKKIS